MTPRRPTETRDDLLARLSAGSPSARLWAARQIDPPLNESEQRVVLEVLQGEPVPQIRIALEGLLEPGPRLQNGPPYGGEVGAPDHGSGDDLAKLISHELLPAIGRARLEASLAIPDFDSSETSKAFSRLSRRVAAVVKIVNSRREQIVFAEVNALEVVQECADTSQFDVVVEVVPEAASEDDFLVRSDLDLMVMLLDAALTNAGEAQAAVDTATPVLVEVSASPTHVGMMITNRFSGTSFEKAAVAALGRTTRFGSRGTGIRVIEGAAAGLGVEWDIRGESGVAFFSVRFPVR